MKGKIDWILVCVGIAMTGGLTLFASVVFLPDAAGGDGIQESVIILTIDVTAYSPSPHITEGDPFTMASGRRARPQELEQLRFVAVSRDLMEEYGLEYGDTVWIGFTLEDTMHPRIEATVDLFMRNLDLARRFGRQKRQIIIRRK